MYALLFSLNLYNSLSFHITDWLKKSLVTTHFNNNNDLNQNPGLSQLLFQIPITVQK